MKIWDVIKDLVVVLTPIIVAIITCINNKKTKKDIQLELEKNLKEKDADTLQIIRKINAELESQKQLISWNNSVPQTNAYTEAIGIERYGNISALCDLTYKVNTYISTHELSIDELKDIKDMLMKVKLPLKEEYLYPHEIPYIIDYKKLLKQIDNLIISNTQHD